MQQLFFQAVLAIRAQIFAANPTAQESQLWDSRQLPWFKMVFNRACALQKSEAGKLHQFFQGDPSLCWGSSAFLIVDLTFHGQWHTVSVRYHPPCSGTFAFLGSHTGFIHRTGASVEVVKARCNTCSSKLCLLFSPFEPRSLQQTQLRKNDNCGTATS